MSTSLSNILQVAAQVDNQDLSVLLGHLNRLRAGRTAKSLDKEESDLLKKINKGFPAQKWSRLAELDEKMELSELTESESAELLDLAEALEAYTFKRFLLLKNWQNCVGCQLIWL